MFCFTAVRACRPCSSLWPSVVLPTVIRCQSLNSRSSPATAATQSQSGIKKRVQRRKLPVIAEDAGQQHGVSYFPFYSYQVVDMPYTCNRSWPLMPSPASPGLAKTSKSNRFRALHTPTQCCGCGLHLKLECILDSIFLAELTLAWSIQFIENTWLFFFFFKLNHSCFIYLSSVH